MKEVYLKVGTRLHDFYSNRFALVEPVLHTDIERQVLLKALKMLVQSCRPPSPPAQENPMSPPEVE